MKVFVVDFLDAAVDAVKRLGGYPVKVCAEATSAPWVIVLDEEDFREEVMRQLLVSNTGRVEIKKGKIA